MDEDDEENMVNSKHTVQSLLTSLTRNSTNSSRDTPPLEDWTGLNSGTQHSSPPDT